MERRDEAILATEPPQLARRAEPDPHPLPALPKEVILNIVRRSFYSEKAENEEEDAASDNESDHMGWGPDRWTQFTGVCQLLYDEFAPLVWETLNIRDAQSARYLVRLMHFYQMDGGVAESKWLRCPLRFSKRLRYPSHEPDLDLASLLLFHKHNITELEWYSGVSLPSQLLRRAIGPTLKSLYIEWRPIPYALTAFEECPELEHLHVRLVEGYEGQLTSYNEEPDWIGYIIKSRLRDDIEDSTTDMMRSIRLEETEQSNDTIASDIDRERTGRIDEAEHGDDGEEEDDDDDDDDGSVGREGWSDDGIRDMPRHPAESHNLYKGRFGRQNPYYAPYVGQGLKRLTLEGYGYCALYPICVGPSGVTSRLEELDLTTAAFDRGVPYALLAARKTLRILTLRSSNALAPCQHDVGAREHRDTDAHVTDGFEYNFDCEMYAVDRCFRLLKGRMKALELFHLDIGGPHPASVKEFVASCPLLPSSTYEWDGAF